MQIDNLLFARDDCVACGDIPACNCADGEECIQISRSCETCTTNQCVASSSGSGSGSTGGVSKGAVAGAVVGSVLFFALVLGFYFWWRKKQQAANKEQPAAEGSKDVPAPADKVLSRPDPIEKHASQPSPPRQPQEERGTVRVYPTGSNSIIDLDPHSQQAMHLNGGHMRNSYRDSDPNPFGDSHSIVTTSTGSQSTNVIPIALVPPGSVGSRLSSPSQTDSSTSLPSRPLRSPDINLNLEHLNVSRDTMPSNSGQDLSPHSGINRNSYMSAASGASYASDVLTEAPIIVTQSQRQVLGAVKAEVVHAPGSSGANSLKTISVASRPPVRSPLATSAFGPTDIVSEQDDGRSQRSQEINVTNDPFDDHNSLPAPTTGGGNRTSAATFGSVSDNASLWTPLPQFATNSAGQSRGSSRPISLDTQAGSIIGADIRDATRVHLGFVQPNSAPFIPATPVSSSAAFNSSQRSPYRMTSGRLVTPTSGGTDVSTMPTGLEAQQARALAEAKAVKAQAMEDRDNSRMSMSTVASNGADSILESFPFVPPSPISNRPIRTPPRSPLVQSNPTQATSPLAASHPQTLSDFVEQASEEDGGMIVPPNRKMLGMSTGSQMSNMSTGLGSFPFQIETSSDDRPSGQVADAGEDSGAGASAVAGRQRASLDTLALTSDLSSYPLGVDRN